MLAERPVAFPTPGGDGGRGTDLFINELRAQLKVDGRSAGLKSIAGFFTASDRVLIGPKLLHIVEQLQALEHDKNAWVGTGGPLSRDELRKWYSNKEQATYSLLTMPFEPIQLTAAQQAVRLALCLHLCCDLETSPQGPPPAFLRSMAQQIRLQLEQTDVESTWVLSFDLLHRVVALATSAARDEEQREWFLQYARRAREVFEDRCSKSIEEITR